MHAKKIRTGINFDGKKKIVVDYRIDEFEKFFINIDLPFEVMLEHMHLSLLGLITSFVLAKLCLAEEIDLEFPIGTEIVNSGLPLLELLYDARCYRDHLDLRPLPRINIIKSVRVTIPLSTNKRCDPFHAQLLWSGGKDSTLSLLMLQANGYKVSGFHATINEATKLIEMGAASRLGELFSHSLEYIRIDASPFAELGTAYSSSFGKYPAHNSIPQGRDFILFTVLAILSKLMDSNILCSGSEFELYSKVISYQGKAIYRHDAQSRKGYSLITAFLSRWFTHGFQVFSPVAALTEYRSFKVLTTVAPKSFEFLNSCFWSNWCGECFKCFRYSLIQKTLGIDLIKFKKDPLAWNPFMNLYINEWENDTITYREEIYYCLNNLAARSEVVASYEKLRVYASKLFPKLGPFSEKYHDYLFRTHPVDLVPEGFRFDLLG